jgi:hypothetical protein
LAISKKLDRGVADELRNILSRMNLSPHKVTIDFDNDTLEVEDDYSIDDILDSTGILTAEQGKEMLEEIQNMRNEDWN